MSPLLPLFPAAHVEHVRRGQAAGIPYIYETTELGGDAQPFQQLKNEMPGLDFGSDPPRIRRRGWGPQKARLFLLLWKLMRKAGLSRGDWRAAVAWRRYYRRRYRLLGRLARLVDADVVCQPEENVERDSGVWANVIRDLGGASLVISYQSPAPIAVAQVYAPNPDFHVKTRGERIFSLMFPPWAFPFSGKRMLRLPMWRALALELEGASLRKPWVENTGNSDAVVVESEFVRDVHRRYGAKTSRFLALGHPSLDVIHKTMVESAGEGRRIREELGMDDRPIALFSLPGDIFYRYGQVGRAKTYAELLEVYKEGADLLTNFNVIFTPHPSILEHHLRKLEQKGAIIIRKGAAELISTANLYVAPVSLTIKWARACGLPVVNWNIYGLLYSEQDKLAYFDGANGVWTVAKEEEARELLGRMNDPAFFADAVTRARAGAGYWGLIDGRSCERIMALIEHITRSRDLVGFPASLLQAG